MAISCVFCCDLSLTSLCPGLLQNKCLREIEVWKKRFSNKLVTRVTQGFNVLFPLPSLCVSSQMDGRKESCLQRSNMSARNAHKIPFSDGKSFTNCRRCGGFQRFNFLDLKPAQ